MPITLKGVDHLALIVPDLVEAEQWYVDVLGAEVISRYNWGGETAHQVPPHEDLRIGDTVVSLFLGEPAPSGSRLVHYAFGCRTVEELDRWRKHFAIKEISFSGPRGHQGFPAISIYFTDPYGYSLEIVTWLADFETTRREIEKRGGTITGPEGGDGKQRIYT
jgi:catechol 2,3-dioxygenase-like lactoylglutathione lyase family enzyme